MLFVPYIAEEFEPALQFKVSGLLAVGWLAVWARVGGDQPPDLSTNGIGSNRGTHPPALVEEGSMEAVPMFNKKEDPMPLLSPVVGRGSGGGDKTGPSDRRPPSKADGTGGIPWGVLFRSPAVWAIVVNNFAFHYATYVLMNWLPTYFQSHIGEGLSDMGNWYKVRDCAHARCRWG